MTKIRSSIEKKAVNDFHCPVLLKEVLKFWHSKAGGIYVDGTVGGGGHMEALLQKDPQAKCIGIDRDLDAIKTAEERLKKFGNRVRLIHDNYIHLPEILKKEKIDMVHGVLLDLGVSSSQLDNPSRGFSFRKKGPLDMRMNRMDEETALDLIRRLSIDDLRDLIQCYGEEKCAKEIAIALKNAEQNAELTDTLKCAEIISKVVQSRRRGYSQRQTIHDATRTFQALRIAVNKELEHLKNFLNLIPSLFHLGGRALFISFHSLEDRLIKNKFKELSRGCICPPDFPKCVCGKKPEFEILTKKPVVPTAKEIEENPRSRSAKLRVAEKI